MSKPSGSITGLGLRNKVGIGKDSSNSSPSSSKPSGSISGLGLRNKAGGLMGKGKGGSSEAENHVSRPLSSLKDPASFGPPPKNANYYGEAVMSSPTTTSTGGLGSALSRDQIRENQSRGEVTQSEEEAAAKAPRGPFRIDTTGLSTSHLSPPPRRKDGADGRILPPPSAAKSKPPSLPPRLPPRKNSTPLTPSAQYKSESDAHKGIMNQGALSRLGAAGVSVPGFGIESKKPPLPPPNPSSPCRSLAPSNGPQLSELQSRFSKLSASTSPQTDNTASEGTTWAQKQAALKTASSFRDDPSSVSLSDAKNAAATTNNFRERHGEQIKSGWQSANKLSTNYGIADKVGAYGASPQAPEPGNLQIEMRDNTTLSLASLGKKKAPPPPMKKATLASPGIAKGPTPPPIPMGTRPPVSSHNS